MSDQSVSVERIIDASPETIFDLLADPSNHPRIDGSGSVQGPTSAGSRRLSEGDAFGMSMKIGLPYRVRNVVKEFEENRVIGWQHTFRHRWRWELEPVADGTRVTHSWTWATAPLPVRIFLEASGTPERNRRGMERSLDNLERLVTDGSS